MAKAKQVNDEKIKDKAIVDNLTIQEIELFRIAPSRFEPQARRRARFAPDDLKSLAGSIKGHGLRQPILVRPVAPLDDFKAEFEIVFGERRFVAVSQNGAKSIRCFVENLSDAEVLELQYEENHQRKENHPLDDAFLFKFLVDHESYDAEKLAARFAIPKKEVTEKLKLNDLIPEAVQELADGDLPLRHAYYLSKFSPAVQAQIVAEAYAYNYGDKSDGACPYAEFKEEVEENIIRTLKDAPFDTENPFLHQSEKGLKCSDCAERSGFEPLLFPDLKDGDRCLNQKCFEFKSNVQLRQQREKIALESPKLADKPIEAAVKAVPLVTDKSWVDKEEIPFTEKVLTNQTLLKGAECIYSELALAVKGDQKGQEVYICTNKDCQIHHPKTEEKPADELSDYQRQNLEKDFTIKVGLAVREEIFNEAIAFFDKGNSFWQFADLVEKLLCNSLFSKRQYLLQSLKKVLKKFPNCPANFDDSEKNVAFVAGLEPFQQSQLLFLCTFADTGYMSWRPEPQEAVKQLAKDYCVTKIDYELLDAQKRFELAPEEFKLAAKDYLEAVKSDIPTERPAFWWKEPEE